MVLDKPLNDAMISSQLGLVVLCEIYHCLPSDILAEDPYWVQRLRIVAEARSKRVELEKARAEAKAKAKVKHGPQP